jgi:hypothetical protein
MKSLFNSKRKIMSAALALVLILALTVTALASPASGWPGFQGGTLSNNGTIDNGTPPVNTPSPSPAPTTSLPYNGTIFSGIDTESVINGATAYTLYNGGTVAGGPYGGARVQATDFSAYPTLTPVWNVELYDSLAKSPADEHADNSQQLSTPYYIPTSNGTLYAAKTYYSDLLQGGLTGWVDSSGTPLGSSYTFITGTTSIFYKGLNTPASFWVPQIATDITTTGNMSGTAILTGPGTSINFGANTYYGGNFTIYNNSNTMVPQNNGYQIELQITTDKPVDVTNIKFLVSRWGAYSITSASTGNPTVTRIATGWGQANTPITYDGSNIYWGIYEGQRSYYQYTANGTVNQFKDMSGNVLIDDFYGTGAVFITNSGNQLVVFGSDSGTVYSGKPSGFSQVGEYHLPTAGDRIRSSIADNGTYSYFTSYNGAKGTIHEIVNATTIGTNWNVDHTALSNASTSTPVISANNYIYVGVYDGFSGGGINVIDDSFTLINVINMNAPVQSSPIVWSVGGPLYRDYIYFTTNDYQTGKGYCYIYIVYQEQYGELWSAGGTGTGGGGPVALQGFAANNGYLVYGDDSNTLYVMH